jgi:hypothetical protein
MFERVRGGIGESPPHDPRVGGLRGRRELDPGLPGGPPRGFRSRLPSLADLEALVRDGRLMLPLRYVRGYFLDLYA